MKTINGGLITPEQMAGYLKTYRNTPANDLGGNSCFLCKYIFAEYVKGRSKILLNEEVRELKKLIWQFVAYWYDKLGYGLPLDANIDSVLFEYCYAEIFYFKVQERKEFARLVLIELEKLGVKIPASVAVELK